ncbi:MAG TPA: phosphate/phosphite/phosphonate ABC transporter substrate-binding protein [Pseudonocardiaceae bacterium]|jgi:phosphonate transport system substrate-binding protein|nr:phosphate/phosphite/phosphonate ABC transporter substrate-binding protein [Pseudonocardiaceae bacterium]
MTRPRHRTLVALFAIVTVALIMSGCDQKAAGNKVGDNNHDPHVLVFAAEPSFRFTTDQQSSEALIEMLEKETSKEIRFQTGTDYATVIKGLRDGKIDVAALGPLSYVLAKNEGAPVTLVAVRVNEKGKPPGYRSYGITWTGSPIKTLADFRGRRICFVDRNSTSGYLYPSAALLDMGIDPNKDIIPIFAGGDDASVFAVANHRCDAGFAYDTVVDQQLIDQGRLQTDQVTTVWKSTIIPGPPLVIANYLSAKLRKQLTTALQNKANADYLRANGFCQGKCAISDGTSYGYQPADDADYRDLTEICRRVQGSSCAEN